MQSMSFSKAFFCAVLSGFCIGLSPIFARFVYLESAALNFHRMFFGAVIFFLFRFFSEKKGAEKYKISKRDRILVIFSGFFFAIDAYLCVWALEMTSVVNATLFNNFTAFFVPLICVAFLGERLPMRYFIGLVLSMFGLLLFTESSSSISLNIGDWLAIASAVGYAGYLIVIKELRNRGVPTLLIMERSSLWTALFLLPIAYFSEGQVLPSISSDWIFLMGLIFISQLGGQGLGAAAMGRLSAGYVSAILLSAPVASAVIAWPLFHEPMSPIKIAGGILILSGIVWIKVTQSPSYRLEQS